jgi:hypothetical protein
MKTIIKTIRQLIEVKPVTIRLFIFLFLISAYAPDLTLLEWIEFYFILTVRLPE